MALLVISNDFVRSDLDTAIKVLDLIFDTYGRCEDVSTFSDKYNGIAILRFDIPGLSESAYFEQFVKQESNGEFTLLKPVIVKE